MMKVDLRHIVIEHIRTLKVLNENKVSPWDIFTFYVLPALAGSIVWFLGISIDDQIYSISVSVFAIFSALLLSVQVAMYGVFRSERKSYGDKVLDGEEKTRAENSRLLLREINTNVSYLILISCLSISVFLLFFAASIPCHIETAILVTLYVHFLLTLGMVLKRAHEIFDAEYAAPFRS